MGPKEAKTEETPRRTFSPSMETALLVYGALVALAHIYFLATDPTDPYLFRGLHVATAAAFVFLRIPGWRSARRVGVLDVLFIALSFGVAFYLFWEFPDILFRRVLPSDLDTVVGTAVLIVTLELGRRAAGLALPILGLATIAYALISELPGVLAHPPFSYNRVAGFILSNEGVYGLPIAISASYVALFILFGALIDVSGAGEFLIRVATGAAGWARGGPAKVALVSSGLFGMVSGASSANVVTTGTFTIPLMKRIGYKSPFAGAVEAVASTGGQLMPPVMGAGAFIMAELVGIPYGDIAAAAVIPAVLYYFSLYWMVDLEALRLGLGGLPRRELPLVRSLLKREFYFLFPVFLLIYALVIERLSVIRSAFWAGGLLLVCAAIRPETRMGVIKTGKALAMGAERFVSVMPACAVAGIIVGMLNLTGLGLKLGGFLVALAGGNLLAALVLTMVLCIILGMGLPSVPAYIVAATVTAPVLVNLGVSELAAHFFVFYFAALSAITPPVAIAAYAAAGLANAPPHKVGYLAVKLGLVAFLMPFFFVYGPALLGQGSAGNIVLTVITAAIGAVALSMAVQGIGLRGPIGAVERIVLSAGAFTLIKPGLWTDRAGLVLVAVPMIRQFLRGGPGGALSPSRAEPRSE
ncbi:MAG: TRAP transporter fused permease subunit, partial [Candidatus Tectomicrobia bacterium]|nr:TRAP transporter fused permease subunit [Candidatus Tectomicrobia bacterium]